MGSSPRHTRRTFIPQTLLSGVAEREDDIWPVLSRPPLLPLEPELGNPGQPASKSSRAEAPPQAYKGHRAGQLSSLAWRHRVTATWSAPAPGSAQLHPAQPQAPGSCPPRRPRPALALCKLPRGRRMETLSASRVMALLCLGKPSQSQRGEGNGPVHLS